MISPRPIPALFLAASLLATIACGGGPGSMETATAELRHEFEIRKATGAVVIDGRLDEAFWKDAKRLEGFRVDADPARVPSAPTGVRVALTDEALLVAFESSGAPPKKDDGEFVELALFSRPETPFYSPFLQRLDYMNALEAVRTMRRFRVTPSNGRSEANVHKVGAHTPYIIDESWNGRWESSVIRSRRGWTAELALPWTEIGGLPRPGHTFRLNFVRRTAVETSCFNWASSSNVKIEPFSPDNFIQEYPTIFASVRFSDAGPAVLSRFVETEDPWRITRERPEYERLLTKRADPFRSFHFYLGLSSFGVPDAVRKRYDEQAWAEEEARLLNDMAVSGMNGPFLPAFLKKAGEAAVADLQARYGTHFSYHGYANAAEAKKAGASILTPGGNAAFIDPVYIRMKKAMLEEFLGRYGRAPWLADVWGQDEPFNQIATVLQPGTYDRVNRDLKDAYGVELGVPVGVANLAYERQPVQDNSRGVPDEAAALSRIAVFRWLNRTYAEVARGEAAVVRRLAPGKPYQAFNRNAVADMDFLDQSLLWDHTDIFSADPYPSFSIYVYGPARARYHVGFTSKWVTDFAAGKPTQMILQGCTMIQRKVTPENAREWVSQAAKAGVSMIDWFGTPRVDEPELYREILRLSKLWKSLPALDVPVKTDVAVLFSDDARAAAGDEALHPHYTLHALLGERLGAGFTFVGENHVRRGLQTLDGKKLIFAPELGYLSRAFARDIERRVRDGATLVLLDPDAFARDLESGPLAAEREAIVGASAWPWRSADRILPTEAARARWPLDESLPLRPLRIVSETRNARAVRPPVGATVLFTYEDGEPAAYSRRLGNGEVVVFGAMPFQDSELAVAPAGWDRLLAALLDERGAPRDLPAWRFLIPAEAGSR
jgi:hypothetical protein